MGAAGETDEEEFHIRIILTHTMTLSQVCFLYACEYLPALKPSFYDIESFLMHSVTSINGTCV